MLTNITTLAGDELSAAGQELSATFSNSSQIAETLTSKINEQSKGIGMQRVDNWFSLLEKQGAHLLAAPKFESYKILTEHLDTEWVPHLVHTAVFERGIDAGKAFQEATETAFLCRERLIKIYIENGNFEEVELNKILVSHFVQSTLEISGDVLRKSADIKLADYFENNVSFLSSAVSFGIEHPAELEEVFDKLSDNIGKKHHKLIEYAKYQAEASHPAAQKFRRLIDTSLQSYTKGLEITTKGMRGEVRACWMSQAFLNSIGLSEKLKIGKSDAETDLSGAGDLFIYSDSLSDADEKEVALVVEVKTEKRDELGVQLTYPTKSDENELQTEGILAFRAGIPANVKRFVSETGTPVLSLRIPTHMVNSPLERDLPKALLNAQIAFEYIKKYTPTLLDILNEDER